jgi:U3 small nucleolar RNA-associated protein 16
MVLVPFSHLLTSLSQLSASRKKRKERDDNLKKQAKLSKKRKLEDDITIDTKKVKLSAKEEKTPPTNTGHGLDEEESHAVPEEIGVQRDKFKRLSLSSKRALPDVLPAEYLEDTDPQDHLPFDQFPIKNSKKTKLHLTAEKEPKDRRVGSTTYRVTKASSTNLAPKSTSQARNTKESWLQGRSGKKGATNRTPFTKGFFKK